jgi:6-pyruvoyltetrahydropterin/6-carboxytetrahydropterin synthase
MPTSLTRVIRFSAGHHYHRPEWSDERNRETFGDSVHRHGHNYAVAVTVTGPVDQESGFVIDLAALDQLIDHEIGRLDQRDLTEVVPEFAPGQSVPSTELLARWLFKRLEERMPGTARLRRVRVEESDTLAAEYWEE